MKIKIYEPEQEYATIYGDVKTLRHAVFEIEIEDAEVVEIIRQIAEVLNSGGWHA